MATTIKLKSGSGAPLAGDLVAAEPAFDLTNKRLYTEDSGGTVIEVGTNPTSLTTGTFTSTGIDDNATSTAITIDSSENVGIGTASPSSKLHVKGSNSGASAVADGTLIVEQGSTPSIQILSANTQTQSIKFGDPQDGDVGKINYSHNDNNMNFVANGSERMRIDSSGNVIAGATSAQASDAVTLMSDGEVTAAGFYFSNNIGSAMNDTGIRRATTNTMVFDTNSTERMRIDSSGNVGIGTTSPTEKLSVIGNLLLNNASGDVGVKLGPTGVEAYIGYVGSSGNLQITPRSGYNTTISSGNVGIGTASPSELLHIAESTGTSTLRSQNDSGSFYFGIDNSTGGTFSTGNYSRVLYSGGAYPMVFATNNAERMRILSNGRVGIGTSSPSARLHLVDTNAQMGILASSSSSTYIQFASATNTSRGFIGNGSGLVTGASNSDFIFRSQGDAVIASGGNTERMRIDSSGDVFIGTTGPTVDTSNFGTRIAGSAPGYIASYRNVSGTQSAVLFGGNAGQVFIRGDGDLENTNNSYGAISDERVKSNIVDASSQIDDIMAVQVRSYTLNETGETHIGVVAQELEASGMSGLVQEDDEGMKSVKYSVLYMKAIKALQEAVTRIETLEAEVAALKGA